MIAPPARFLSAGIAALTLYLAAVIIIFQERPHHELTTALLLTGFFGCTFLLFWRALEPLQSLPTMFCMFYFAFFYLLPGAVQISINTFQMADVIYAEDVALMAATVALTFLVCFFIGQALVHPRRYDEAVGAVATSERHQRVWPILTFCAVALVLGILCIARFGFTILLSTRGELHDEVIGRMIGSDIGLLLQLPRAMTLAAVLVALYAVGRWRREMPAVGLLLGTPMLALLLPVFAITNWPLALARNWQFGALISFLIVYVRGWRPWLRAGLVVGMILTMFSLFQWLNALRQHDISDVTVEISNPIEYLKGMDFDGFQSTMNTVIYVDTYGHAYGKQILACMFFFIPRAIWTGKGDSSGQIIARGLGYDFTNLSSPLPAEFFFDFSFLGVIFGGVLIGYLYRRLDYLCAAAIDFGRPNLHLILIGMATGFTIFIMRGSLYAVTNIFAPLAILMILLLKAPAVIRFVTGFGGARHAADH
jgi:hypothetical protein